MATTANPPPGASAVEEQNGADPFVTSSQDAHRQRYSAFDKSQFSLYVNGSPAQAKRALQAHLAETTRRLQETSHLGNALVQQRKELEEKLKEVEKQEEDAEIGPELRQRLAELEKEFNEVGRETARAFLPKSRVPSGETDPAGGASVYSSEALHSPSKVSVPSRKQRNQQPSRINDIALATEISTSLLAQLKDLQAVLLEKDEALRAANLDRSQLEIEVEGLSQRLRTIDESESRLKDVNWNLETQVREFEAQSRAAADKEHRMNNVLNFVKAEKATLEREFEELKQMYAKLTEDHATKTKQHETELSGLRRHVSMGESERGALQRKVDELSTQNQELAKAVAYRIRGEDHVSAEDTSPDEGADQDDSVTPEHSPPPSPSKATPRHGQLESETLKHSLHHAHRMIQQLKNNIHREKTEKIELKRMLQDARDELESNRSSLNGQGSASKRRKNDKDVFKKPARPDRLGALRTGTQEVVVDDDEWEEQGVPDTPSRGPKRGDAVPGAFPGGFSSATESSANEGFETANETSDAAFETANERDGTATETDAFQTGAETLDGDSSDDLTETEAGPSTGTVRHRPSSFAMSHRDSYESTASTSGDEWDDVEMRTPVQPQHPRYKLKVRSGAYRRATPRASQEVYADSPPIAKDSPASFVSHSNNSTPAQGKSLFAELGALSESEDGSVADGTPSRSGVLSPESSPEALKKPTLARSPLQSMLLPRPAMVDSSMMTEPWEPAPVAVEAPTPHLAMTSISAQHTEPKLPVLQMSSHATQHTEPQTPSLPPLNLSPVWAQGTAPQYIAPPALRLSHVSTQHTEPQSPSPPTLQLSTIASQGTEPLLASPPVLQLSSLSTQDTAPLALPLPALRRSEVSAQSTAPQYAPPIALRLSALSSQSTVPQSPPRPLLALSSLSTQHTEPVFPVVDRGVPTTLGFSSIAQQTTEPLEHHAEKVPVVTPSFSRGISTEDSEPVHQSKSREPVEGTKAPPLSLSSLYSQSTVPSEPPQLPPLSMSGLFSQSTEPVEILRLPTLHLSTLWSQATEPVEPAKPTPLKFSSIDSQTTEPVELPKPTPSALSTVSSQATEPIAPKQPRLRLAVLSSQATEPVPPPQPATLQMSTLSQQSTAPLEPPRQKRFEISTITSQQIEPYEPLVAPRPQQRFSNVTVLHDIKPESPTLPSSLPSPSRPPTAHRVSPPTLAFSAIEIQQTAPTASSEPSRPSTAHRISPVPLSTSLGATQADEAQSRDIHMSRSGFFDSVLPETQRVNNEGSSASREGQSPLASIASNAVQNGRVLNSGETSPIKPGRIPTADEGTQTMVSAEQIDRLLLARIQRHSGTIATASVDRRMSPPASPSRRLSNEAGRTPRRPGSSSSMRSRAPSPPPLPADHREVIAAASLKSPPPLPTPTTPGAMGPPTMPASAYKKRPQTPSIKTNQVPQSPKTGGTTPRPRYHSQTRSGATSPMTRRSSVSSFSSEIDHRFNIPGGPSFNQTGLDPNATDPRMIQAITQTMIGEFLWKYTRKAGREGMSENRHRRFFWVHPYTRTLYWSEQDPASAGRAQLKAKSVAIEAIHEISDDNPYPPGLHRKSLVVVTPGRTIKFTATTSQRHETWFNALTYLLRRGDEGPDEPKDPKSEAADEIQNEFNAGYRSTSRQTGRSRASFTSYTSRRTSSPPHGHIPTLTQRTVTQQRASSTDPGQNSVGSRFSSMFRPNSAMRGSFSSRRSKASEAVTYEEPNNSAADLSRELVEANARDSNRMEMVNVRACCDGKHDVGHLHHHSVKGRHNSFNANSRPSLIGSMSSRVTSRAQSRTEQHEHTPELEATNGSAG